MLSPELYKLRPIAENDLEMVLTWRNSEHVRRNMFTDKVITMHDHQIWFNKLQGESDFNCLVFEYDGRPVGVVQFTPLAASPKEYSWGFYLGISTLPSGIGSVMCFLGLEFAFEKKQVRKVIGEVFRFNTVSIKLHKKFGFIEQEHSWRIKFGKSEEVIKFVLSKEIWQEKKKEIERDVYCLDQKVFK